jgi:hypothetical protein
MGYQSGASPGAAMGLSGIWGHLTSEDARRALDAAGLAHRPAGIVVSAATSVPSPARPVRWRRSARSSGLGTRFRWHRSVFGVCLEVRCGIAGLARPPPVTGGAGQAGYWSRCSSCVMPSQGRTA